MNSKRMVERWTDNGGVLPLVMAGLALGAVAFLAVQWPEIQRYLKMRSM